jgi:hypothetical protein
MDPPPGGTVEPGEIFDIVTQLVSLDANGGLVDMHEGFEYSVSGNAGGGTTVNHLGVYEVPEPGTLLLTGAIGAFLGVKRQRRRAA